MTLYKKSENNSKRLQKIALCTAAVLFSLFVMRGLYPIFHGPKITLSRLPNGSSLTDPVIQIKGVALYAKDLAVDGRSLPLSKDGRFEETVVLHPGYNVIAIVGLDKYGKRSVSNYSFVLREPDAVAIKYK